MVPVKMFCCRICCILLYTAIARGAAAQVFSNDAGGREKHFIYEVKQIDEFIERFNNDTGSFIRKTYKTYKIRYDIDRPKLIKTLFNYESGLWNQPLIDSFIKEVTLKQNAGKLNFTAGGWFAEARTKFRYNGAVVDIPLVLRIETDEKNRSKWMIAAVKTSVFKSESMVGPEQQQTGKLKFINPASHANNFIELDKALADKENLPVYFEQGFFSRKNALPFYNAVLSNHAKFLYVKDITYYFLQCPGWIFTVDHFQRESLNSGWLINSLKKVSAEEKNNYLKALLEEQP